MTDPRNLSEARVSAASAPDEAARNAIARAFGQDIVLRYSEAQRLERLGLKDAAREAYSDVIIRIENPDTLTSQYALQALRRLN